MEFNINLNEIFKNVISKVDHTLLPVGFSGDSTKASHVARQVGDIIDEMGRASAKAQGLHHPIVSAEKMRNSEHKLYLMIEPRDNNGKGSVVGLLKMGMKNLFLFDAAGMIHEKRTLCVLDFYIHETKQRKGLGKQLFDFMLKDNDVVPCKLASDKPPQQFFSFLNKHYGLAKIYPQNNNFVLFEGFFDEKREICSSPESFGNFYASETEMEKDVRDGLQSASDRREREDYLPNLYGRNTAFKLQDTLGQDELLENMYTSEKEIAKETNKEKDVRHHLQDASDKREREDYLPNLHGRHTAFKLPDTMGQIIGDSSTNWG